MKRKGCSGTAGVAGCDGCLELFGRPLFIIGRVMVILEPSQYAMLAFIEALSPLSSALSNLDGPSCLSGLRSFDFRDAAQALIFDIFSCEIVLGLAADGWG